MTRSDNNNMGNNRIIMRPSIDKFCKCCGSYGYCVPINRCDFAAHFVNTTSAYLKANPGVVKMILSDHHNFEAKRQTQTQGKKGNMAKHFTQTAFKRDIKIGAKIRTLFDIVGGTLEEDGMTMEPEDEVLEISSEEEFEDSIVGQE